MILADTSVWIDYFNGIESAKTDFLDAALAKDSVVIGDVIFLEVLQGFRRDKDYDSAKRTLKLLDQYTMLGVRMVEKCARNYRSLRNKGITVRRTTDIIIATFCIEHRLPLLHADRDFVPFEKHLGLINATGET
ncbi:MAG: PIN domain nuclease [Gammaproteobacteria bacterium]